MIRKASEKPGSARRAHNLAGQRRAWVYVTPFTGSVHTMELALATANYLHPIADALVFINTTKVHPVWFPYAVAPTLHAARISIVYQSNARRSPSALSWGTYITGYLIMVSALRPSLICVG